MVAVIHPSCIQGTLVAPPGKSSMQRACAAALLHKGVSILSNPGKSNDDLAALDVIAKLGAIFSTNPDGTITITSNGVVPTSREINCGESGLGIRMFSPIAALSNQPLVLNGEGSLANRPMHFFDEIFPLLGVQIKSANGKLPLHIQGPLQPANITVDGSLSSQFITGLLMAFSSAANTEVTISVNNLTSKPYIALTLDVLQAFCLNVPQNNNYQCFTFHPNKKISPHTIHYTVEGDWSSASFLLVAAAIAGSIIIKGLSPTSSQADKSILNALQLAGCIVNVKGDEITVNASPLKAFGFDATDCPDLFPPLVALAANCVGTSIIQGVHRLQHKESSRGITLQQEFAKMGVKVHLDDNLMHITGGPVLGTTVYSHHDHRIAMACAVAALNADGPVTIEAAEAINKSYPGFYADLKMLSR